MTLAPARPDRTATIRKIEVRKRSGELVNYDVDKIRQVVRISVIKGAGREMNENVRAMIERIVYRVDQVIQKMESPVVVEVIQDLVTVYMELEDSVAAQAFRTYREEHRKKRLESAGVFAPRTSFKPFEYPQVAQFKDAIRHSYWVHTEWNFNGDVDDFHTRLQPHEKETVKRAMLAISQIEVAVKRFWGDIGKWFPKPEIEQVGATFAESEVRHADAYSHLLQVMSLDDDFASITKVPAIRARIDYLKEMLAPRKEKQEYAGKLALFSMFIENCSLFTQFAVLKSFAKHRQVLKDVDNVVQATQREETLHAQFGAVLINLIKEQYPEWFDEEFWFNLKSAARDAFEAESQVIDWMMEEGELEFLNKATLKEFMKHRINESLAMIGGPKVFEIDYDVLAPLEWFEDELDLDVSIDFFHTKSTAYTKHAQAFTPSALVRPDKEPTVCKAQLAPEIVLDATRELERFWWLNEESQAVLHGDYLLPGVTPETRILEIAEHAAKLLKDDTFAPRFLRYMSKGFYSLSSPVWANFGYKRGLPISCFGSHIGDTIPSILDVSTAEVGMMSKYGGGTSGYYGDIRPRGSAITNNGTTAGAVNFMRLPDTLTCVISQGSTRRGQFAAYLPFSHRDFDEFLTIRDDGHPIQNLNFGACLTAEDYANIEREEKMLKQDPNADTPNLARWGRLLAKRAKTGYPYIFNTTNANNGAPACYRDDDNYNITHSNLCTEIMLPDCDDESFVCCLGSLNLYVWPEIVEEGLAEVVRTKLQFLDAVLEDFIQQAEGVPHMEKAVRFSKRHRAVGMGVLGWHSYMQRHNLAIDTSEAHAHNRYIFGHIKAASVAANQWMGEHYGSPEVLEGTGLRFTTTMAIAPTKTSSFILGQVSEGIEPWKQNVVVKKTQKGVFTVWNPELLRVLDAHGRNDAETKHSIKKAGGSVQHLNFLTEHEKRVFRTFIETPQMELVTHAAERQTFIDQGQSLNLMIDPNVPAHEVSDLYMTAHTLGIKSLYYQHSVNAAQQLSRALTTCTSCEG